MSVTLPFTETAVAEVAALLNVPALVEPYRVRDAAVYRLALPNASLGVEVVVILWPSLGRVDVRFGDCSMVSTTSRAPSKNRPDLRASPPSSAA